MKTGINRVWWTGLLAFCLFGCKDYPGRQPNKHVKLSSSPIWGEVQEIVQGGDCHIDSVNDKPGEGPSSHAVRRTHSFLKVVGWGAISVKTGITAKHIAIALRSNTDSAPRLFALTEKVKRPDVAEYFKNKELITSGFSAVVDISDVVAGSYILEVIQHQDGVDFKCPVTSIIIVGK